MEISITRDYAIVSTDILRVNNKEMRQMYELNSRIKDVLDSHKAKSKEKKYISDDDLNLMHAILSVFTEGYGDTQTSTFDNFLKKQEQPAPQAVEEDDE